MNLKSPLSLHSGCEQLLSFNQEHPKCEYIKIFADKSYNVRFNVKWSANGYTSCPLQVTLYRVTKDFAFEVLYSHVTVYVNTAVNLDKTFPFELKNGERLCMSVKNLSPIDFHIEHASLTAS